MNFFANTGIDGRQKGLSLIELMIALVLGLLVVGAIVQLFIGSRATQMSNEALARVQENGRFTMELLKREFRDVGSHGFCAADIEITNHLNMDCSSAQSSIFDPSRAFVGWEYDGTGRGDSITVTEAALQPSAGNQSDWQSADGAAPSIALPDWLDGRVVPGSDVVVITTPRVLPNVTAAGNTPPNANSINLSLAHGLADDAIVLVTNCTTGADLFQNVNSGQAGSFSAGNSNCDDQSPGNINGLDWSTSYDESMQAFEYPSIAYYIGFNDVTGEPGLYRETLNDSDGLGPEELVEGIETMQVLYGYSLPVEQGGDGQTVDFWLPADEVPDWQFVIGVRLSMLLRSPANMAGEQVQRTFDLASTQFTHPEDGRLRQPFFASISLRNRQIVM